MAKQRRTEQKLSWKKLGFIPPGYDDSRMIKYGDDGFLYLCRELRDDWREFSKRGYTVRVRNFRPGQGGRNCAHDWTGLNEALIRHIARRSSPHL
jgi:hypothetical protein